MDKKAQGTPANMGLRTKIDIRDGLGTPSSPSVRSGPSTPKATEVLLSTMMENNNQLEAVSNKLSALIENLTNRCLPPSPDCDKPEPCSDFLSRAQDQIRNSASLISTLHEQLALLEDF